MDGEAKRQLVTTELGPGVCPSGWMLGLGYLHHIFNWHCIDGISDELANFRRTSDMLANVAIKLCLVLNVRFRRFITESCHSAPAHLRPFAP